MRYDGRVIPEVEGRAPADAAEATLPKACPSCRSKYPADALFCAFDGSPLATSPAAMAALAASDVYIGHEIVGPIEIRQLVGIGAMGRVYRGFQKGIDRDVAVKILHRELSSNPTVVARFHREAKVASRLAHPNVVHVLLTGQLPDGAMYMVMEYLDGMSLQSALAASGGAMPLPRALHIALGLCDAVGEAHAQGIVHRDLKPENVMLVTRGDDPDFVKALEFGIARLNWGDPQLASAAGLIFGTARYISPEGAQGEKVGPPGDVYSIATMLYQMLSGRTPFDLGDQAVALTGPPDPRPAAAAEEHRARRVRARADRRRGDEEPREAAGGARPERTRVRQGPARRRRRQRDLSAQDMLVRPGDGERREDGATEPPRSCRRCSARSSSRLEHADCAERLRSGVSRDCLRRTGARARGSAEAGISSVGIAPRSPWPREDGDGGAGAERRLHDGRAAAARPNATAVDGGARARGGVTRPDVVDAHDPGRPARGRAGAAQAARPHRRGVLSRRGPRHGAGRVEDGPSRREVRARGDPRGDRGSRQRRAPS